MSKEIIELTKQQLLKIKLRAISIGVGITILGLAVIKYLMLG